jgi:histone acetyltransferase (RNA polymerase elongator complex component)
VQELVRKSVYEFLLQLDVQEVASAFSKENQELWDMVFSALRDADVNVARMGLQIVYHLLNKTVGDSELQALVHTRIVKDKL